MAKTPFNVYVVPVDRGHFTNAYGAGHTIAGTDNYGKFLTSAELDLVIGHELGQPAEGRSHPNRRQSIAVE
jgi:hypothetical protein